MLEDRGEQLPDDNAGKDLARRFRHSQQLTEVNHALVGVFDFDAVTRVICEAVRRLLGSDGATFVVRDGAQVHYVNEDAIAPLWKGQRFPIEACVSGRAMLAAQPQVIDDIYADPSVPHAAYRPTFVTSLALVPVGPGLPVASIGAYWAGRHAVNAYELDLMCSLASAADLALAGVRAYEEARRGRAEAEQANHLKDEFLATLSHELRNPLNVIVGYAELLRQNADALSALQRARAVDGIYRNAYAQSRLVNDLLDLARLRTGKLTITREPCALTAIVEQAADAIREMASAKGVAVHVHASQDVVVNGDPVRLQQIMANLAHNGVKFTPSGGSVTLQVIRESDRGIVSVIDTGRGIDPGFLPYVFDMFRQADGSSTRSHEGLGIGLALVRQLVELHDGSVCASSAGPDRGSTFVVQLPLHEAPALAHDEPLQLGQLAGLRLLVVDDVEDSAEMLAALLSTEGANVSVAMTGDDALRLADGVAFDLILSDISMPGMDGYQLLSALRELARHRDTPAVALSGLGREVDRARTQQVGFAAHLTKPVNLANLVEVIRKALQR
jgi:signal transduction histidine kinase